MTAPWEITGDEAPLTTTDIGGILRAAYPPRIAALVLRGTAGGCDLEWMRGIRGGITDLGDVRLDWSTDRCGIWARLHTVPPRAGLIRWARAEQLVRDYITPQSRAEILAWVDRQSVPVQEPLFEATTA